MFSPRTGSRHADDVRRLHGRMARQRFLDLDGGDVHAGGLDDVLDAAAEVQVAVVVEVAAVAGAEESVGVERRRARGTW